MTMSVRVRVPAAAVTAVVAIVLFTAACTLVSARRGEGAVTSESRQMGAFSRVQVTNGVGVTIRIGPAEPVQVRAQANILPLIATELNGNTLSIHSTEGYTTSEGVNVTLVVPALDGISMAGGSQGTVDGLNGELFTVDLNGGSGLTATGTASTVTLTATGGSRATLADLSVKKVVLHASGGSNATLRASDEVSGEASGGSHATVLGGGKLNVQTSGGSAVTQQ